MLCKKLIITCFPFFLLNVAGAQGPSVSVSEKEIAEMNAALEKDSQLKAYLLQLGKPAQLLADYKLKCYQSDSVWKKQQKSILKQREFGSTKHLEIIPIVEAYGINPSFKTENAVSYLIKTDDATILFDLGANLPKNNPPAILSNMKLLGINLSDVDDLFITHNHGDHNGGMGMEATTFSIGKEQPDLKGIRIFTPVPMNYPGSSLQYIPDPTLIEKGIVSTGIINSQLFLGQVSEQSLIVNVEGKGLVIISGCGHQTIGKIIERTQAISDEPIYAVLGGFHLPMTAQENITPLYKYFVTGKLPWESLTQEDIHKQVELLRSLKIQLLAMSRHDSCPESIRLFREAFPKEFIDLLAGKPIKI